MSQRILVVSGRKQSGKNSAARFIAGTELRNNGVIKFRDMNDKGDLLVNATVQGEDGKVKEEMGVLDIEQDVYSQTPEFTQFLYNAVYPHVRLYAFADPIKEFCVDVLGLKPSQVYGNDHQKNSNTKYTWNDFKFIYSTSETSQLKKEGKLEKRMSAREIMEVFGTDIVRKIESNAWLNATIKRIEEENCPLAIVTDARFPNEIKALKKLGATTIRFTRDPFNSDAPSEVALDKYNKYDITINNENMTMTEKNQALMDELYGCGFFKAEIGG